MEPELKPEATDDVGCSCKQVTDWVRNDSKKYLGNIALLTAVMLYTCLGAKIFQALEFDVERDNLISAKEELDQSRQKFIKQMLSLLGTSKATRDYPFQSDFFGDETDGNVNDTTTPEQDARSDRMLHHLKKYEHAVKRSLEEGVPLDDGPIVGRWQYTQSFFFSATVLTTVGYGNIAPSTAGGRIFCMIFALIGIPLTLSGIAVIGDILASVLPLKTLQRLLPECIRVPLLKWFGSGKGQAVAMVLGAVVSLLAFIALGGAFFMWREDWTFMESIYFCFISTTTIGFGDLVPDDVFFCTIYVLVGLSLTSTVIELVRRQYATSWDHMKQLSTRLHTLSGPLAEAMRRMAETGAGTVDMDMELVRELRDLNVALAKVHEEEDSSDAHVTPAEDPWTALLNMAAKKKRITVIMYESNV
ncbi:potassium channel subfamily K member 15-like isoform X1 [Macrobrachium rosenbergii]|uniref:potassium channel subfamily K member 15-like isoform X1 n=1 Tax=Macrobrachium rosenbergii TaxID=79674 RepID=UPI0034D758AF